MGQHTGVFTHERRKSSSYESSCGEFWVLTISLDSDFEYSYLSFDVAIDFEYLYLYCPYLSFDVAITWLPFIANSEESDLCLACPRKRC